MGIPTLKGDRSKENEFWQQRNHPQIVSRLQENDPEGVNSADKPNKEALLCVASSHPDNCGGWPHAWGYRSEENGTIHE